MPVANEGINKAVYCSAIIAPFSAKSSFPVKLNKKFHLLLLDTLSFIADNIVIGITKFFAAEHASQEPSLVSAKLKILLCIYTQV